MKLRDVRIQNFRSFGPALRTISFVDELTEQVRPLSILVGSNGSGKTTILETIEALLRFAIDGRGGALGDELRVGGFADLSLEFADEAPKELRRGLEIALGYAPSTDVEYTGHNICLVESGDDQIATYERNTAGSSLLAWIARMTSQKQLTGGLISFPHRRWIERQQKGAIDEPDQAPSWISRHDPTGSWTGSLSQAPFVEAIEAILGRNRRVVIRDGRVNIETAGGRMVELHRLPSGEQQVLTLFGEVVRRLRPGGILMIDEVETSMHPALQRVVLAHLRELAQKYDLQLILTTHSMEIVAAVAPSEILNLDDMVLQERARAQATSP